jgi:hypothetical protein
MRQRYPSAAVGTALADEGVDAVEHTLAVSVAAAGVLFRRRTG